MKSQAQPRSFRLVDRGWAAELIDGAREVPGELRIVCPFIKERALDRLLQLGSRDIRVITRFNLADFADGVSDIAALRNLLRAGAAVRGIRNLHAKLYLFGEHRAIVASANLTEAGLRHNSELGVVTNDASEVRECRGYFDDLWSRGGDNLRRDQLDLWDGQIKRHLVSGWTETTGALDDFGVDAGLDDVPRVWITATFEDVPQAFVKLLGESSNRAALSLSTVEGIVRSCCHWAVGYPAKKRPRSVEDGAAMFISRLVEGSDSRVFGVATAMKHVPGRDDATEHDIELRPWKENWPRYIRIHHPEFVAGTLANGISLSELMDSLGADSFASTKRNKERGHGNQNPRRALMQQPAVKLSENGYAWLNERLQKAFKEHGRVPASELRKLDQPGLAPDWRSE
ncbi:MAG: phospholipase D family protein [Spirochaetaceae bacterium]|nr:phospholipase D family protein [Spirochaetaceae bacterium]